MSAGTAARRSAALERVSAAAATTAGCGEGHTREPRPRVPRWRPSPRSRPSAAERAQETGPPRCPGTPRSRLGATTDSAACPCARVPPRPCAPGRAGILDGERAPSAAIASAPHVVDAVVSHPAPVGRGSPAAPRDFRGLRGADRRLGIARPGTQRSSRLVMQRRHLREGAERAVALTAQSGLPAAIRARRASASDGSAPDGDPSASAPASSRGEVLLRLTCFPRSAESVPNATSPGTLAPNTALAARGSPRQAAQRRRSPEDDAAHGQIGVERRIADLGDRAFPTASKRRAARPRPLDPEGPC
jgi:hypothetical protein